MENQSTEFKNLHQTLIRIGEDFVAKYKEGLVKANKVATGKLLNSIDYKIEFKENGLTLKFLAEDYWINVEEGRKPNSKMPPVAVIKKWLLSRNIKPKYSIERSSYLIARSIGKKGIKGTHLVSKILEELDSLYIDDINKAIEMDLELKVNKIQIKNSKYIEIKNDNN